MNGVSIAIGNVDRAGMRRETLQDTHNQHNDTTRHDTTRHDTTADVLTWQ
jgi:hypothetical protein